MGGFDISLNGQWNGIGHSPDRTEKLEFKGRVPGSVHGDLMRNSLLPDIFFDLNAEKCQFIENWEWRYQKDFEVPAGADLSWAELEFAGLDTYCHIYLNGQELGFTEDMFIPHTFEAGQLLRHGTNRLELVFHPSVEMVRHKNMNPLRSVFGKERLFVRRMQCTFGWDWVNRFVSAGLWGPVTLHFRDKVKIREIHAFTSAIDSYGAEIGIRFEADTGASSENADAVGKLYAAVRLIDPDGMIVWQNKRLMLEMPHTETASIRQPRLWWPAGFGEQPLYSALVVIEDEQGRELDRSETRFGIRTVRILQLEDMPGTPEYEMSLKIKADTTLGQIDRNDSFSGFYLLVNGCKIMCKGANWVPPEPFPGEAESAKYRELVKLAREGNYNILRVWGGGMFENEAFYDACDSEGIMLMQDFLMACAQYPENDMRFMEMMKAEAEYGVKRLRNHPSLVWWSGDNELAGGADDDDPNYWGRKVGLSISAKAVNELDGHRPFMPSDPWGGKPNNSLTKGTAHSTFFLNYFMFYIRDTEMRDYAAHLAQGLSRFQCEAPIEGMTSPVSLRKFMSPEHIYGDDKEVYEYHFKNHPGREFAKFKMSDALIAAAEKLFGVFTSPEDRVRKMMQVQYVTTQILVENHRRAKFYNGGILFWMYNDCWPAIGWSMVDYYCLPKSGWYAMKKCASPVIISANAGTEANTAEVWVCSDSLDAAFGRTELAIFDPATGHFRHQKAAALRVAANESRKAAVVKLNENEILICSIKCKAGSRAFEDRTFYHAGRPQDLGLRPCTPAFEREGGSEEGILRVTAPAFAYGVQLEGEYIFSDNFFCMLPGETKTVTYRSAYGRRSDGIKVSCINDGGT